MWAGYYSGAVGGVKRQVSEKLFLFLNERERLGGGGGRGLRGVCRTANCLSIKY